MSCGRSRDLECDVPIGVGKRFWPFPNAVKGKYWSDTSNSHYQVKALEIEELGVDAFHLLMRFFYDYN